MDNIKKSRKYHLSASIKRSKKYGGFVIQIDGDLFHAKSYNEACYILIEIVLRDEIMY